MSHQLNAHTVSSRLNRVMCMLATTRLALEHKSENADSDLYNLSKTIEMAEDEVGECVEALDKQEETAPDKKKR